MFNGYGPFKMSLAAVEPTWVCSACACQNANLSSLCHLCGSSRIAQEGQRFSTFTPSARMMGPYGPHGYPHVHDNSAASWNIQRQSVTTPNKNGKGFQTNSRGQAPGFGSTINGRKVHSVSSHAMGHSNEFEQGLVPTSSSMVSSSSMAHSQGSTSPSLTYKSSSRDDGDASQQQQQQRRDPKLGQNADEDERKATEEGRKVFVGNLKRPVTRQEVIDHFSKFGEVERVILNSGFGLVLMATREGALKATEQRWQALDWRNVEVFVYTKGAKGATWNRPYAVPPRPGPCSLCGQEAAEHCSLCTASLCLTPNSACTVCCRTCQRSFCQGGKECGLKEGLESCDHCHSLTCLFCVLRLEATCSGCFKPFSDRMKEKAKTRAMAMVNARIGENDGSVYALVCLLKGDHESAREGQLVASIDRASKLFDPKASALCLMTAMRSVKELEEAWESTKKVHNLRALRRSAKQWSTDLSALMVVPQANPQPSPAIQLQKIVSNASSSSSSLGTTASSASPAPFPHAMNHVQQSQHKTMVSSNATASAALSNTLVGNGQRGGEDMMLSMLRSTETFLSELDPRPKLETDWLVRHLRNISMSVTKKRSFFLEELCMRMEIWALVLHRLPPNATPPVPSSMSPVNVLKKAIIDLDSFCITCKSKEDLFTYKDAYLSEVLNAARELKRTAPPLSSAEVLLKRAGRSIRNCEMRALLVSQNLMALNGCLHHQRYKRCSFVSQVMGFTAQCPFSHEIPLNSFTQQYLNEIDQREFDAADYEFSNEQDELFYAVAANMGRGPSNNNNNHVVAAHQRQQPQQQQLPPGFHHSHTQWNTTGLPSDNNHNNNNNNNNSNGGYLWSGTSPSLFLPPPSHSALKVSGTTRNGTADRFVDWNTVPDKLIVANEPDYELDDSPLSLLKMSMDFGSNSQDLAMQVASLCDELKIDGNYAQITAAFVAAGGANHEYIWDTDVASLHKELSKISTLPAATRVKIINMVSERRHGELPAIASMLIPPLL